jgi:HTH-type transcriptional regulator/antitoxin HipB
MNLPLAHAAQLSAHLKSLRKAQGLTQTQLGARIGVKQTRIADIERNPGAIAVEQLLQLLHALGARLELVPPSAPTARAPADPADW